jgi:hypothetical protein
MTEDQIEQEIKPLEDRLLFLQAVLNYSRVFEPLFFRGEKICINQERGALFDLINHHKGEMKLCDVREYRIPKSIEDKIEGVKYKIIKIYNL